MIGQFVDCVTTGITYLLNCYTTNNLRWVLNSQPLDYKPSALSIGLNSSIAIAGNMLSLSSWCIASLYISIISELWLTSHPRRTVVLLDTGTPGTIREAYSEDTDNGTQTRNPSVIN